jgi:hypothetical protein
LIKTWHRLFSIRIESPGQARISLTPVSRFSSPLRS